MKVQITHMKAPWPEGAKPGDVIEVPQVPAWAIGKCIQVGDDVEVTLTAQKAEQEDTKQPVKKGSDK